MFKIFNIGSRDNADYVLYYSGILPLSYQIDFRKLRFYHVKYTTASPASIQLIYLWLNTAFSILLQMPSILKQFGPSLLNCYFSRVFMLVLGLDVCVFIFFVLYIVCVVPATFW